MSRLITATATPQLFQRQILAFFVVLFGFGVSTDAHMEDGGTEYPNRGQTLELARGELDFRLPSTDIRAYSLGDLRNFKSVLLIATDSESSQGCVSASFERELQKIQPKVAKKNEMKIVLIDVAGRADREAIAKRIGKKSILYLFDHLQMVARSFQLGNAYDFVLIDPGTVQVKARGNLLSAGAWGDSVDLPKDFRSGWTRFLKLENKNPQEGAKVCPLSFESVKIEDFKQNFLRPFARACLGCHVASQVHDTFTTLDQVIGWRAMSLRTIRLMRMPGRYDPYYYPYRARSEKSDPFIEPSNDDLQKVVAWLSNPPDLTEDMRRAFLKTREVYVQPIDKPVSPDPVVLTVEMKEMVKVPAEGPPIYINAFVGEPLKEDITLQGLFLRTNMSVVHHTTIFIFDPKKVDRDEFVKSVNMGYKHRKSVLKRFYGESAMKVIPGTMNGKKGTFNQVFEPLVATYSRRQGLMSFPPDSAMKLPKGMQLAIQLHIEPSGKPEEVSLSFDLLSRASTKPFSILRRVSVEPDPSFRIRAHEKSFVVRSTAKFEKPILLKAISIHTHYRGIAARIQVQRRDGKLETIASFPFMQMKTDRRLSIPYDGFQIEAGASLISEVEYDNSAENLANPDPEAAVALGGATIEDEMHYPRYLYLEQ